MAWARVRQLESRSRRHFQDLDTLLIAQTRLGGFDERGACDGTCAVLAELAESSQAHYYRGAPSHLLLAGRHGAGGAQPALSGSQEEAVTRAMRDGLVSADPLVVPVPSGRRILGVVLLHDPNRHLDRTALAALAVAGRQLGPILQQLRRGMTLDYHLLDPQTGIGNEAAAAALIADVQPGDALALVRPASALVPADGSLTEDAIRDMAVYLRRAIRPTDDVARLNDKEFLLLLRDVHAPVEVVMNRVLQRWRETKDGKRVHAGAALHLPGQAPLETLDRTRQALRTSEITGFDIAAHDRAGE